MRAVVSAILTLAVFLLLQYGKTATYYYCKWQADQQQSMKDCGCESQLEAVFGGIQHHDNIAPPNLKIQWVELTTASRYQMVFRHPGINTEANTEFSDKLLDGFSTPLFHPPIA